MRTLIDARMLAIVGFGFASGLPLVLSSTTLQAWFTVANVDIVTIGFIAWMGYPYLLKFLWAPLCDRFVPPFLDRRRAWILLSQAGLIITIAAMGLLNPTQNMVGMALIAVVIAFLSATQDVNVDAYRTDILKPNERGIGSALYVSAYRIAMLLSGGLALIMADSIGWQLTYYLMALLLLINFILTRFSPNSGNETKPRNLKAAVVEPWREFLSRDNAIALLLLILFYKMGDAFAQSLATPFLLREIGLSLTEVGTLYKVFGLAAALGGALIAGIWMMRISLFRALLIFGSLQALANLPFLSLAIMKHPPFAWLAATILFENLTYGMEGTACVALLMALCHRQYTATQFALLSAVAAVGRVMIGPIAGMMVKQFGWVDLFLFGFIFALPGLVILLLLRGQAIFQNERAVQAEVLR